MRSPPVKIGRHDRIRARFLDFRDVAHLVAARDDAHRGIELLRGEADDEVPVVITGNREYAARRFNVHFLQHFISARVCIDVELLRILFEVQVDGRHVFVDDDISAARGGELVGDVATDAADAHTT